MTIDLLSKTALRRHSRFAHGATPCPTWRALLTIMLVTLLATPVARADGNAGPGTFSTPPTLAMATGPSAEAQSATARGATPSPGARDAGCPPLLRHTLNNLQTGQSQSLCQYSGKVVLIVNTASFCGFTNQYEGLEALYRKYRDRGLVVLGFPSNDYGAQEPGSNKEIAEFCRTTYGIQFPMFEKAAGTRLAAHPLYAELAAKTGQAPRWNFHKYLVDRTGRHIESFGSTVEPGQRAFVATIERLLADKPPT